MTFTRSQMKCGDCFQPVARRLGLFNSKDEYECYGESYVKCFWGMCDSKQSLEKFTMSKGDSKIITTQPLRDSNRSAYVMKTK